MRCTSWLLGLALVLVAGVARAEDTPQQILDKAIAATGGEENINKLPASTWKSKGTVHIQGMSISFNGEWAQAALSKSRTSIEVDFNGQKFQFTSVLNGDKGWRKMGDNVMELADQELKTERDNNHAHWITQLTPLKDKAYTLAPLKEIMVDNKPAVGFNVTRQGYGEVKMYFDKQTNLLVKSEFQAFDMQSGGEVKQEVFYSDYKDVQGMKMPMKSLIKRNGEDFVNSEITEVKRTEKLEDKLFQAPQ
jgi:hypothetical protein